MSRFASRGMKGKLMCVFGLFCLVAIAAIASIPTNYLLSAKGLHHLYGNILINARWNINRKVCEQESHNFR